jgi:xylulokinase
VSILGVDVGTSGLKAVAFRVEDGAALASAQRAYRSTCPRPGWMELDPGLVWSGFEGAVREVGRAPALHRDPIAAMALSVSCDEVVPVAADGHALARCIMAPDVRGADDLDQLTALLPDAGELYRRTGLPISPIHPVARIHWTGRHDRPVAAAAARWLGWAELLLAHLGLPAVTDETTAGRWLAYDVRAEAWMPEVLAAFDIVGRVPEVISSGSPIGRLGPAAEGLGLDASVLVVAGAYDQVCAALGAGLGVPGDIVVGTGSWENTTLVLDAPLGDAARERGITWGPFPGGRHCALIMNPGGGAAVRWFREQLGQPDGAGDEPAPVGGVEAGEPPARAGWAADLDDQPLFLPHLAGSLSPWRDPAARGAFVGLTLRTTREVLYASVLEGITFELRLNLESLPGVSPLRPPIRNTGGGSRAPEWVQLKADVLGLPVARMAQAEPGCQGAAILAAVGAGLFREPTAAQQAWCRPDTIVQPDRVQQAHHESRYQLYRQLYPAIRGIREGQDAAR